MYTQLVACSLLSTTFKRWQAVFINECYLVSWASLRVEREKERTAASGC